MLNQTIFVTLNSTPSCPSFTTMHTGSVVPLFPTGASSIDNLITEMRRRNNNIGHGLGVYLGRLLGTIPASTSNNISICKQKPNNLTEKTEQYTSKNTSPLKATTSYSNQASKIIDELMYQLELRKKAIEFIATADHNGAFNPDSIHNIMKNRILENLGYSHASYFIDHPQKICQHLLDNHQEEKFDAILLSAHGYPSFMRFGSNAVLTNDQVGVYLNCFTHYLKTYSKIILNSCSTGDVEKILTNPYPLDPKNYSYKGENLAISIYRHLSVTHPFIEIAAPSRPAAMIIRSIEPLILDSFCPYKNFEIDCSVIYNQLTIKLIDEKKALLKETILNYDELNENEILLKQTLGLAYTKSRFLPPNTFIAYSLFSVDLLLEAINLIQNISNIKLSEYKFLFLKMALYPAMSIFLINKEYFSKLIISFSIGNLGKLYLEKSQQKTLIFSRVEKLQISTLDKKQSEGTHSGHSRVCPKFC